MLYSTLLYTILLTKTRNLENLQESLLEWDVLKTRFNVKMKCMMSSEQLLFFFLSNQFLSFLRWNWISESFWDLGFFDRIRRDPEISLFNYIRHSCAGRNLVWANRGKRFRIPQGSLSSDFVRIHLLKCGMTKKYGITKTFLSKYTLFII